MSLLSSSAVVGSLTLVSRAMGFVRDILIAAIMGAGPLTDTFLVAFKLPNFFRRLFAEGAFNAAFVPMFSKILNGEGKAEAKRFAEQVFAVLLFVLLVFTLIIEIAMPWVMVVLAPGFVGQPEQFDLAVLLSRITFPYLLLVSLVALLGGVMNSLGRFAAAASAPIVLNCCLIGALLWLVEYTPTPAHALAWGVAAAGVAQLLWLLVAAHRAGYLPRLVRPRLNAPVKRLLKLMGPGVIGAGVVQINLWIDVIIGTLIPGAISYLYYADRVNQLPLAVVGTAIGTALLPMLSRQIREGKLGVALDSQNRALEIALFFTLPAAMAFIVIALPIITVLFERGAFGAEDSRATAYGLMAYAFGLPAFVMIKVFTPGFFADEDTKTPVKIAVLCLVVNVVLNLTFVYLLRRVGFYPHIGLAFATTISAWVNAVLLSTILADRGRFLPDSRLKKRLGKMLFASAVMGAVLWAADHFWIGAGQEYSIPFLLILVALGAVSYFGMARALKLFKIAELRLRLIGK